MPEPKSEENPPLHTRCSGHSHLLRRLSPSAVHFPALWLHLAPRLSGKDCLNDAKRLGQEGHEIIMNCILAPCHGQILPQFLAKLGRRMSAAHPVPGFGPARG